MATIKQQRAVKNLVGNGGNVTKAMIDANYSLNTANTPQKLTESKGFQELWDKVIPDELLTEVHREGLEAVDPRWNEPDYSTRHKYLDTAYKLKGSYAPEKSVSLNINTAPEIEARALDAISKFLNDNRNNNQ